MPPNKPFQSKAAEGEWEDPRNTCSLAGSKGGAIGISLYKILLFTVLQAFRAGAAAICALIPAPAAAVGVGDKSYGRAAVIAN